MAGAVSVAAAPMVVPARVLGAVAPSKQITLGFGGLGNEGYGRNLKAMLVERDARVVAVCDVMASRHTRARETVDKQYVATGCKEIADFRDLIARKDIDAMVIVPQGGKRFQFDYEYDFGDGWQHEVLFEGCLQAEKGSRYPLCLEALANPDHQRHEEFIEWSGSFDPEKFDAQATTKAMRKGLPNWPEME
jgi:hypothetical protein